MANTSNYTEENIKSLDWREHIRLRPGMYIGKSGDGSSPDDGIYVLLKEIIDNCVDEFVMGEGIIIDIVINDDFLSDISNIKSLLNSFLKLLVILYNEIKSESSSL